jgi:hypothetical protein
MNFVGGAPQCDDGFLEPRVMAEVLQIIVGRQAITPEVDEPTRIINGLPEILRWRSGLLDGLRLG